MPIRTPALPSLPRARVAGVPALARVRAVLGAALLAGLAAGCAELPTRPSSGPIADIASDVAPASSARLSSTYANANARLETAERVWRMIGERFYDPAMNGVDWNAARWRHLPRALAATSDAEFYRVLKDMVAELHDSHTLVLTPREALDRRRFMTSRTGLTLTYVEGRIAVAEVDPASPAASAAVAPGEIVAAINGKRVDAGFVRAAIADPETLTVDVAAGDGPETLPDDARDAERVRVLRAVQRLVRPVDYVGMPAPLRLELLDEFGAARRVELKAQTLLRPPMAEHFWLDGGVLVLKFNRFLPEVRDRIEVALDAAVAARGIIIDLRGNGGGLLETFRWFCGQFVADERIVMRSVKREREQPGAQSVSFVRIWPPRTDQSRPPLLQPLAVLVDGRTASAGELTAVTLAEQRGALLVGEPTCGCVVGVPAEYVLPDRGGLRISETGFFSARGQPMEGRPTVPEIRVQPRLADLRAGRDVVLETAHRHLLARLPR
ncbi:MAG TPA: S41 family peptidase [Burkholderiaceae bacterium]|nr:S41 family peptidase [Burkholderiaceae bacterium]